MQDNSPYAAPRHVSDLRDCYFYHLIDLPGHGTVGEEWDLRGAEDAYLGHVSFQGKRVLELGTASGFLCRYMESNGASVVGFDLSSDNSWDLVPFAKFDISSHAATMKKHIEMIKNGWWLAHRLLGSEAKAVYGDIYAVPREVGFVDVSTFGALLLHLRDPFQALCNVLQLTRETVIVTEVDPEQPVGSPIGSCIPPNAATGLKRLVKRLLGRRIASDASSHAGTLYFLPNFRADDANMAVTWWCFPATVVREMLGVLGFERTTVTVHRQLYRGKAVRMYTVVGHRTKPLPPS